MFFYKVATLTLQSEFRLVSFNAFICPPCDADVILERTNQAPSPGTDIYSGRIVHRHTGNGWFFHATDTDEYGLYVDPDYSHLRFFGVKGSILMGTYEWFVRIAIECRLARMGYVSLHAAAVEVNNEAIAFSGHSGIGKSTRARAWSDALGSEMINGDRPLIDIRSYELYGVPWDGKEMCFRNVHYPMRAICEIRRSNTVYVRKMSFDQKRKFLIQQCFMPMWDTDTAMIQMMNITRLATNAEIVRAFGGPTAEDARALYSALQNKDYLKEELDMKAKTGFVLRNVVDEFILMPTGDNIGKFNGTVLLNEVSAFVWEKLQNPLSREDLLTAILDEFEVDKATASDDLDALLQTLRGFGVIEDD